MNHVHLEIGSVQMLYRHCLNLHPHPYKGGTTIVSIFQIRKLRLRKVKCLVQGHIEKRALHSEPMCVTKALFHPLFSM